MYPYDGKSAYEKHRWCLKPGSGYRLYTSDDNQNGHVNSSKGWDGAALFLVRARDGCVLARGAVPYDDRFSGNSI